MQIDEEKVSYAIVSTDAYQRIERKVVDLYNKLNITIVPFDVKRVADLLGYKLIPYSRLRNEVVKELEYNSLSGCSLNDEAGDVRIFYDDRDSEARQRFTIMHEIGHILLGHKQGSEYAEQCANHFAAYSLCPTPLIGFLYCWTRSKIMQRFNVSKDCARIALGRGEMLEYSGRSLRDYEMDLVGRFVEMRNKLM